MGITPTSLGSLASAAGNAFAPAASAENSFTDALSTAVQQVNNLQTGAEQKVTNLLAGNGEDVHAATLSVERASLAFDLMLQVRNKMVSAYQEISRLQF
jgi:flagellar hook-basal body complex protein FliE